MRDRVDGEKPSTLASFAREMCIVFKVGLEG